jgi:CubicO group peptidase (beta-lactamase class C family)
VGTVRIEGLVEPGFAPVADALARNFERSGEVGAACCLYADGRPVVDIWAGDANAPAGREWRRDTLALVFSTTKGVTAICANLLIERDELDPDAPVARYWPEFAANGKERVLVRHVLSHSAGLPVVEGDFTLPEALAWDPVVEQLARQAPRWEPGSRAGYHVRSFGWLTGELVRRVTGRTLGRFVADEVAAPLGLDLWIGLPAPEEPRVARLVPPPEPDDQELRALMAAALAPGSLMGDAMSGPSGHFHYDDMWNTRSLHAVELPSSNGIASARALARMYAATVGAVDGHRLLAPGTVTRARTTDADGTDAVLGLPMRYGLGFALGPSLPPSCGPHAFGHPGAGGSLGFADDEARIGFGYVMNAMQLGVTGDPRSLRLARAAYAALG